MKKLLFLVAASALMLTGCNNANKECKCNCKCAGCQCQKDTAQAAADLDMKVADKENVDLAQFPKDKDGYIVLFDGKTLNGWRGYGMDKAPKSWTVKDGAITLTGSGTGEAHAADGGDLIFAHKFQNFTLELEYRVTKGANSGIFYLAQEVKNDKGGMEPIFISAPECQVLDNENHPDAKLGVDGNRKASSLYDMIPAKPQNAKPYGEWNQVAIVVNNGTVTHFMNGAKVVTYKLWTPEWTQMLQNSKFSEAKWPVAFQLLNNCGGENHEGFIGMQDHGDTVWFKNIKVKELK